jgi:lipopolysaccharide/colanic/teichoic acid biosynthesis glycosyltransferase
MFMPFTEKKRMFDIFFSMIALIIFAPVILLVALVINMSMGRPIFFRQIRPGLNGKAFSIYKFRTMTGERDEKGNLLPDSKRLSSLGKFLRSTSLDELPELLNVLKGEMSLVGPRPLLMQYLDRYTFQQARRHEMKPGITGWAQINGRNAITWEQKFEYDVWYVNHQSMRLDFKIMVITILKIIKREGINQPGQATAEEFNPQITRKGSAD